MLAGSALVTGALVALAGGQSAYANCTVSGTTGPTVITCGENTTTTNTSTTDVHPADTDSRQFNYSDDVNASVGSGVAIDGYGLGVAALGKAPHAVSFDNAGSVANTQTGNALDLSGNGGTVTYTGGGDLSSADGRGLLVTNTGSGDVTVTIDDGSTITSSKAGVDANVKTGTITIDQGGTIATSGTGADGIDASALTLGGAGDVMVTTRASSSIDATGNGIRATSSGAVSGGAVTVGTGADSLITADEDGIDAFSFGGFKAAPVSVTTGDFSGIDALGVGIAAVSGGVGAGSTVSVTTGYGSTILSGGDGIDAFSGGLGSDDAVTVTTGDYSSIDSGNIGINAASGSSKGSGAVTVITGVGSTIDAVGDGIGAFSLNDVAHVENWGYVGWNNPVGGEGIHASSGATGDEVVFVESNGPIWSTGTGIHAEALGDGGVTVHAYGDVTSTAGSAIVTSSARDATIDVGISPGGYATVTGVGDDTFPVIDMTTGSGATTTLNIAYEGTVEANDGALDGLAVRATGGSAVVDTSGVLTGRLDFSGLTGGATASVYNNAGGDWYTSGTSTFGPNADYVSNAGLLMADGAASFQGLEAFDNSGTISLGYDPVEITNGLTGDTLSMPGTSFYGAPGSTLALDAHLGGPGSTSDQLLLPGGSTSGTTGIVVRDTNGGTGAYNPGGITLVDVGGGTSHAGDFVLDSRSTWYNGQLLGGVIDKPGLFMYGLTYDPATEQHRLVSELNVTALQLPSIMTAAQDLWYRTSPWHERQADTRPLLGSGAQGAGTPGVWAKAFGDWGRREGSSTLSGFGRSQQVDTSYDQDVGGGMAGVDFGMQGLMSPDDSLRGGLMAGYVSSLMRFDTGGNTVEFTGPVVGAYATYLKNGLFVDAQIKADILSADLRAASSNVFDKTVDVRSYGGTIDAGQRIPLGFQLGTWSTYAEPLATLAYVHTEIDGFSSGGTTVDFQDGDSLRGSLGLRVGTKAAETSDYTLELNLTGRVWNEFLDTKNTVRIGGAGPNRELDHGFDGTFGEVGGGFDFVSKSSPWSGFVNAGYQFSDNYEDARVTGGVRYHF